MRKTIILMAMALLLLASAVHALDSDPHLDVTTTFPGTLYNDQSYRGTVTLTCDGAYQGVHAIVIYLIDTDDTWLSRLAYKIKGGNYTTNLQDGIEVFSDVTISWFDIAPYNGSYFLRIDVLTADGPTIVAAGWFPVTITSRPRSTPGPSTALIFLAIALALIITAIKK